MHAEAFQVVDVVLALGGGQPFGLGNHHVAVHEMHERLGRVVSLELQEPQRIRELRVFDFQVDFLAVRLLEAHLLQALVAVEVMGQGHGLDIIFPAMRAHVLADGDIVFGLGHVECEMWGV